MKILNVTLNPSDMGTGITLSNGNLSYSGVTARQAVRATHGKTSGKWYWEVKLDSGAIPNVIGISNKSFPLSYFDNSPYWRSFYPFGSSSLRFPESTSYGSGWVVGDIIGVALDLDNGTLEFYKNGLSMGVSHKDVKDLGEVFPTISTMNTSAKTITFNFGATPFAYSVPPKFNAYNVEIANKFLISSNLNTDLISLFKKGNIQNIVPTMTSNATSGVTVSASSISSGYDAYLAFNGQADGGWQTNNTRTGWLKIDFGKPQTIRKFSITASTNAGNDRSPKTWTLQGSNTGSFSGEETILFTGNESRWTSGETKEYVLNTFFTFRYYRLNITDVIGALNYANIGELRFFEIEKQEKRVNILDSIEEVDFIKYGMEKNYEIVLSDNYSNKSFIKKSNAALGSGKVFKQKIDTTKIPIKKASIT